MKKNFILRCTLFICSLTFAQKSIDLFTISGHYGLPSNFEETYSGKATETGMMANLVVPIVFNKKQIWYNSVNYMQWNVSNNVQMPSDIANPIHIHGIILRTGLIQKLSNKNSLQILFAPRLMTDFHNVDSNHLQLGGTFIYEKIYHEHLKIGYGVLYNQETFGPNVVPLVNLDWQITERWSMTGLLPIYSKIKYKVNEKLNLGMHHFGLVTSYRLGEEAYKNDYIERRSIDLGLFARYKLIGNVHAESRFGYSFGRSYAQYDEGQKIDLALPLATIGDDRIQKNINFSDGAYLHFRLVYALPL